MEKIVSVGKVSYRLIQKYNTFPELAKMQNRLEVFFCFFRLRADVGTSDPIERFLGNLSHAFGSQGFTRTWTSMQQQNQAISLIGDEISAFF